MMNEPLMVGCEDETGLLHIHLETETCEVCEPLMETIYDGEDIDARAQMELDRRAWEGRV